MKKILLVEDDKSLREIYGVRMQAEGYDVVLAENGEEGLAQAVAQAPDLIISDAMMPKISGFEMLDLLKSNIKTRDIKVIMMTALSSDNQKERGELLGAERYLVKSQVGIEDLVQVVHEVLGDKPTQTSANPATSSIMNSDVPIPPTPMPIPTSTLNPIEHSFSPISSQPQNVIPLTPGQTANTNQQYQTPTPNIQPIPNQASQMFQQLQPAASPQAISASPNLQTADPKSINSNIQPNAMPVQNRLPNSEGGVTHTIQPVQEAINPRINIDDLLAKEDSTGHSSNPIFTPNQQFPAASTNPSINTAPNSGDETLHLG